MKLTRKEEKLLDCIAELVNVMDDAIESGDWVVDGACDPDSDLEYAKLILKENGRPLELAIGWLTHMGEL